MSMEAITSLVPYAGSQSTFFPACRNAYALDHPREPYRDCIVVVLGDEADGTYGSHGRPLLGARDPEYVNLYV
ncbi:MAG: hypothetical protein AB1512_14310 [Thermodesulfobacteriota bacterium]